MRLFLIIASCLILLAWFTSEGRTAPIRQEGESPIIQESFPSSASSAVAQSSQAALQASPVWPFRTFPIPVFFMDQSGNPHMIVHINSFQELEKEIFQEDHKNTFLPYSLQKIEATGQVEGQIAHIRFELTLITSNDPFTSIPIGLREGVYLQPSSGPRSNFEYIGEGSCELTVDPQSGDYLLLVQNSQQTDSGKEGILSRLHQVTFTLSFPVESIGPEEQRMRISTPQAVSSRLLLSVPILDAVATEAQGVAILRSTIPPSEGGTQFEILGFPKLLDLSWYRQVQSPSQEKQVALQVENALIFVRMTQRETDFDATLRIRAIGGPLQRFQVRLPPHTRYFSESLEASEYKISEITPSDSPDSPVLEVEATGTPILDTPFPVRIRAVRIVPAEEQEQLSWCELGGFEVIEAERQSGHVEIHVSNDLQLRWQNLHGIRLGENSDPSSLSESFLREETQVRFDYHMQPFSLEARVTLPQSRTSIKPEYQVLLEKREILLKGEVQVVVSGAKTNQLQWNFHDWQLENIGPPSLVDFYDVFQEENGITTIPLRFPSDGPIELSFTLRHPMPPIIENQATVGFSFPEPVADRIEPATVAIVPADNLELLSVDQEITGMLRENRNIPLKITLPNRQQSPLLFRSAIPGELSKLAMSFRSNVVFHQQEVQAHSKTIFQVLEPQDQVKQMVQYNVKFEPLDQITLLVPRSIHDSESLKISFDGRIIPDSGRFPFPDLVGGTNLVRRRITLPTPLIGHGTLLLQYSVPQTNIPPEMTVQINVPQILPVGVEIVEQTVVASAPGGVNILLSDGNVSNGFGKIVSSMISLDSEEILPKEIEGQNNPWRALEKNGDDSGWQETVFSTTSWEPLLSLSLWLDHRDILGTTVVEQAWIQTWLTDQIRVDQASFRIQSDREKIALFLPSGFHRAHLYVTWDNTPIPFQYEEGAIVIVQPRVQRAQSHLLVVRYQMPSVTLSSSVRGKIDLPYFEDDVWVKRTYWQVVLSKNQHLFGDVPGWTPEFRWNWTGMYWKRDSSLSQEELELWIGASGKQDLSDSPEIARYLFSSFSPRRQSELLIINREKLILLSSGSVLLIGFVLIYFPRLRQVSVLFALAVFLGSIFLYKPTPAFLVFQASILGVVVSLVSAFLARILSRESDWKYVRPSAAPYMTPPMKSSSQSSTSSVPQGVLVESTHHKSSIHELDRSRNGIGSPVE